jgi:NADPH2:quinone reductase
VRAWQATALGEPTDVLRLIDVARPSPPPGHQLVEVAACVLQFPDVLLCRGTYQLKLPPPFVPGGELSGTLADGRRVSGPAALPWGGLAQYAVIADHEVRHVPDVLDDAEAAVLYGGYETAWMGLHRRAHVAGGDWVLVHAAVGGVGSAAIDVARAAGARVVGVVNGPAKVVLAQERGCELVIDRAATTLEERRQLILEATGGRGVEIVFDPVGGEAFELSTRVVAFEGVIVVVGFASGTHPRARLEHALVKNYGILGLHLGLYSSRAPAWSATCRAAVERLVTGHGVRPMISRRVAFEDAPATLEDVVAGRTHGRAVALVAT